MAGTLWTLPRPLLSATWTVDPLRGRAIQFWVVSGLFWAPGSLTPSERGRSNPWARGDPGVTASRAGGAGPWTGYEARSGSAYSAGGVAPMDPDDPMISCLPLGRSSRGGNHSRGLNPMGLRERFHPWTR